MQIKVIFDKDTLNKKLYTGWGVSFLIGEDVLFDTGEKGEWLLKNMVSLDVDIDKLESVVISHDHWDHTGGLWDLLKIKEGLKIYACPGFGSEFKRKVNKLGGELIENNMFSEIKKNIFVTGEIAGTYKGGYMPEQALVVKTAQGVSVVTGCAHPGMMTILKEVKKSFVKESLYLVIGGFHLMEEDKRIVEGIAEEFKKLGVKKAAATHCTGYEAQEIFRDKYHEDFVPVNVGGVINL